MAEQSEYLRSRTDRVWRLLADLCIYLAAPALVLVTSGMFALWPDQLWASGDGEFVPTAATRVMAALTLVVSVPVIAVVLVLRRRGTRESLASEQKVELWGGAVGSFLFFTVGSHVVEDAFDGLLGTLGLISLLGAGLLIEPLRASVKRQAADEKDAQDERRHRETLAALARAKDLTAVPPEHGPRDGKAWRRSTLWRRR